MNPKLCGSLWLHRVLFQRSEKALASRKTGLANTFSLENKVKCLAGLPQHKHELKKKKGSEFKVSSDRS